ncbi:MAG: IclR family transcriptional regulator [Paracoccus sp. (in: a-proteobacteria)]|uniref:IclR family transcriptional regulator n=1 Tax=Paracoccus sp. TaxID=267 RepID=UPI00391C83CA
MAARRPGFESDRAFATTLARGLSVLRAFRTSDDGLSNAQIAERTGLPKSTVSRLTFTLGSLGYLTQPQRHDRYRLGPTLMALGHVAQAGLSFLEPAQEMMQALADETGAPVLFALRDRDKLAVMRVWRPARAAAVGPEIGQRLPLAGSASGLAVLGASTGAEFARLLADRPDPARDGTPLTALRDGARGQLAAQGYVMAQARLPGLAGVSVPFRSARLAGPAAFTCAAGAGGGADPETGPRLCDAVAALHRLTGAGASPVWADPRRDQPDA